MYSRVQKTAQLENENNLFRRNPMQFDEKSLMHQIDNCDSIRNLFFIIIQRNCGHSKIGTDLTLSCL